MGSNDKKEFYKANHGTFEKLNKLNYIDWRANVTAILKSLKAFKIVNGEEQPPIAGRPAVLADYEARRAEAETLIRFSVSEKIRQRITRLDDPAEMWTILKTEFDSSSSKASRAKRAGELYLVRPNNNEKISDYCERLIQYRQPLDGTDEEIPDKALITHIFASIPKSFNVIVHFLRKLPPAELTLQHAVDELAEFERTLEDDSTNIGDRNLASTS